METTTPFDLNQAIQSWRENLAQLPAFRRENLDELEAHLRDSIATLQARELSAEESFLIAARRLGQPDALGQEFGNVNSATVWRHRAFWMLAGMLFFVVGGDLSRVSSTALTYFGSLAGTNGYQLGWLSVASEIVMFGLVAAAFWMLAKGKLATTSTQPSRMIRHPVIVITAALAGTLLLKLTPVALTALLFRNISPESLGQTFVIKQWFNAVGPTVLMLILVATMVWLLSIRRQGHTANRVKVGKLVLPIVAAFTLSSGQAQTNSPTAKTNSATLDQAMKLWNAGKQDEATAVFLAVDFNRRPLFPSGSVLNYTEKQFMALSRPAAEKLSKQMFEDVPKLKGLCVRVKEIAQSALSRGDKATAEKCTAQLKQCATALDYPDSLALLKLVGKAVKKIADEPATPPKN